MHNQRKLSNYLIKRETQIRITLKFVFFALISSLLSGVTVYFTLWPTLSKLASPEIFPILRANVVFILFWMSVVIVLLVFVTGILITHRIAGPAYNITNKLDRVIRGQEVELVYLRKGDELQELADKVNTLFRKLEESGYPWKK